MNFHFLTTAFRVLGPLQKDSPLISTPDGVGGGTGCLLPATATREGPASSLVMDKPPGKPASDTASSQVSLSREPERHFPPISQMHKLRDSTRVGVGEARLGLAPRPELSSHAHFLVLPSRGREHRLPLSGWV